MELNLKTQQGMSIVSDQDIAHLKKLHLLFKRFRETNAIVFQYLKEGKPVDALVSKLWRISDEIIGEMRQIGEMSNVQPKGVSPCPMEKNRVEVNS